MQAAQVLTRLHDMGISLALLPGGRIEAAPKTAINDDARRMIRAHKTEICAELIAQHNAIFGEAIEEKAAVLEFDAGMERKEAEATARRMARAFRYRLADDPGQWLVMIAIDEALDLEGARAAVAGKFGAERVLEVVKLEVPK